MPVKRPHVVQMNIEISHDEKFRLQTIAKCLGISQTELIRQALQTELDQYDPETISPAGIDKYTEAPQ